MVKRIDALDGIRLLGVYGVVLYHLNENIPVNDNLRFGSIGVYICFALSGFLYGFNHEPPINNKGKIIDLHYAKKKLIEFWPMHLLGFLLASSREVFNSILFKSQFAIQPITLVKAFTNLTLLQSWIPNGEYYFSFNGASWYLSAVMFFYLLAPTILKGIYKVNEHTRFLLIVLLTIMVICACRFQYTYLESGSELSIWLTYINPIYNLLLLSTAVVVGVKTKNILEKGTSIISAEVLTTFIMGFFCHKIGCAPFDLYLLIIVVIYLVIFSQRLAPAILGNRLVKSISSFSMETYLIHQPVLLWSVAVADFLNINQGLMLYIATLMIIIVSAMLAQKVIEKFKNFIRFKRRGIVE